MSQALFGPITQVGYLVDDLQAGVRQWIDRGVGPWTCFHNVVLQGEYRGQKTEIEIDVALSYLGEQQIELIKLRAAPTSPYQDDQGQPILGIHHLAWLVDDLDATVSRGLESGLEVVFRAQSPGLRVAYLQPPGESGVLFELLESDSQRDMIAQGIAAARNWDGSNPVHIIDFKA